MIGSEYIAHCIDFGSRQLQRRTMGHYRCAVNAKVTSGANGLRELILYASPGILYRVDTSTNVADPSAGMPWQQITLTNLFSLLPVESNAAPSIFYRARE